MYTGTWERVGLACTALHRVTPPLKGGAAGFKLVKIRGTLLNKECSGNAAYHIKIYSYV